MRNWSWISSCDHVLWLIDSSTMLLWHTNSWWYSIHEFNWFHRLNLGIRDFRTIIYGEKPIYFLLLFNLARKPWHMFSVGTHLCHYILQWLTQDVSESISVTCVAACVIVWSQTIFHFVTIVYFISRTEINPCCSSFESDTNSKELQRRQNIIVNPKVISGFKFKITYILSLNLITF